MKARRYYLPGELSTDHPPRTKEEEDKIFEINLAKRLLQSFPDNEYMRIHMTEKYTEAHYNKDDQLYNDLNRMEIMYCQSKQMRKAADELDKAISDEMLRLFVSSDDDGDCN